jgi:hypothetical protein
MGLLSSIAIWSPPLKADVSENGVRASKLEETSSIVLGCREAP